MKMENNTDSRSLLLGMSGWPHPAWRSEYFPDDLPEDWEFSYYANDADCLLLSEAQWQTLGAGVLAEWAEDVSDHFRFYLQVSGAEGMIETAEACGDRLGGLLVDDLQKIASHLPQFHHLEPGYWSDRDGNAKIMRVSDFPSDLRAQRGLIERLPETVQALLIADSSANPGQLGDLRRIAELLGRA